jgi:hypothetical protein
MKKLLFFLILLFVTLPFDAQTRKQVNRTKPKPTPVSTSAPLPASTQKTLYELVRLDDGRVVNLYTDGTYNVILPSSPATVPIIHYSSIDPPVPVNTDISVRIRGGVITNGGDVKAVARTDFIIFGEDISPLLATFTNNEGKSLGIFEFFVASKYRRAEGAIYEKALEKIKPKIVGTFTTDFDGNGSIKLPRRTEPYLLYGYFDVGRSSCMWYLKVPANEDGSYILENKNAEYCS